MTGRWARPTRTTIWAMTISFNVTALTALFLGSNYDSLPLGVPVRYELGEPLIYQVKTPLMVMLPAAVQLGLFGVFGALVLLLLWRARPPVTGGVETSEGDVPRMRLAAEGIALLAAVWIAIQALVAVELIFLWRGYLSSYGEAYTWAMFAAIVASIAIGFRTMKLVGVRRRTHPTVDAAVWRWRRLYFNRRDPSLFVAPRTGVGWTLNFGRPFAIVLLATTLVAGIGGPYLLARYVLRGLGS